MAAGSPETVFYGRNPLPEHSGIFHLHLQAAATLRNDELREQQQLPWGVSRKEWIAAKTVTLFEQLVQLVTVLQDETCTPTTCPEMVCGRHVVYSWADEDDPTPRQMPAIEYMRTLVEYTHKKLSDPNVLPQDAGNLPDGGFKADFVDTMEKLHRRFFRVYAHAYTHHFQKIQEQGCEAELNFQFKHWLFFVREFDLVPDEEFKPMRQLVAKFEAEQESKENARGGRKPPPTPADQENQITKDLSHLCDIDCGNMLGDTVMI